MINYVSDIMIFQSFMKHYILADEFICISYTKYKCSKVKFCLQQTLHADKWNGVKNTVLSKYGFQHIKIF